MRSRSARRLDRGTQGGHRIRAGRSALFPGLSRGGASDGTYGGGQNLRSCRFVHRTCIDVANGPGRFSGRPLAGGGNAGIAGSGTGAEAPSKDARPGRAERTPPGKRRGGRLDRGRVTVRRAPRSHDLAPRATLAPDYTGRGPAAAGDGDALECRRRLGTKTPACVPHWAPHTGASLRGGDPAPLTTRPRVVR